MTGGQYARGTQVPVEQTQMEIAQTLRRYRATHATFDQRPDVAVLGFRLGTTPVRIDCPMPPRAGYPLAFEYESEVRRRWRALALIVKAKLEGIAAGITTVEAEFMANVVDGHGHTAIERAALPSPPAVQTAPLKRGFLSAVVRELSRPRD